MRLTDSRGTAGRARSCLHVRLKACARKPVTPSPPQADQESLCASSGKEPPYAFSVFTSALTPFHKICTPIHTNKNEDNRRITFIPLGPTAAANRAEYP